MLVRQRLRNKLDSRGGYNVCWSCALQTSRYACTSRQQLRAGSEGHIRDDKSSRPKQRSFHSGRERSRHVPNERPARLASQSSSGRSENQDVNDASKPNGSEISSVATHRRLYQDRRDAQSAVPFLSFYKELHLSKRQSSSSSPSCRVNNWKRARSEGRYVLPGPEKATDPSRVDYAPTPGLPCQYSLVFNSQPTSRSFLHKEQRILDFVGQRRHYATATSQIPHAEVSYDPSIITADEKLKSSLNNGNIREHLRLWQEIQDGDADIPRFVQSPLDSQTHSGQNLYTQSGEDDSFKVVAREQEAESLEDDGDTNFVFDSSVTDVLKNELFLRKGDLVELWTRSEPILAIFIRNIFDQCQFYTMRGEWLHRISSSVRFAVPRFAHPEDLKDLLPFLPTAEIAEDMMDRLHPLDASAPREAGAKVLEMMLLFQQTADNVFRKNADRLNRAYELIAPKGGAGMTTMNLGHIAMNVLQKKSSAELTPAMMWAVHRALVRSQNITSGFLNHKQNVLYELYPQSNLAEIDQVREWARDFQESVIEETTDSLNIDTELKSLKSENPIISFVKKARSAIERNRQTRTLAPNGCLGPCTVKLTPSEGDIRTYRTTKTGQRFNNKEKIIIRYFDAWVTSRYLNPHSNFKASGPMILRAIGMYDGHDLAESTGFTLLQELGIISPWENRTVYGKMQLPDHDDGGTEATQLQKEAFAEGDRMLDPPDSMKHLRKDWADLPVFCIDNPGTLERDDGISVQTVEGTDDEHWVHIHVANPSAFIKPDSATARYAAHISESVYFPERKYPMISPAFTHRQLSLANDRPCLTFSARMSIKGDILENTITPGIVRNVHHLAPDEVSRIFGGDGAEQSESMSLLAVGGDIPCHSHQRANNDTVEKLPEAYIGSLRKLLEIGEATRKRRTNNGSLDSFVGAQKSVTSARFFTGFESPPFRLQDDMIRIYEGDPIIDIETTTGNSRLGENIVSNLMILAGEIAASWCKERSIPIPYRGIARNPEPASSPEAFKSEVIDPQLRTQGHTTLDDAKHYLRLLGVPATSSSPLEHLALGLPAYCKATSPLRRYIDLYTHWQIEAALRHEVATGQSLLTSPATNDAVTSQTYLPFSRASVEDLASTVLQREKKLSSAKIRSMRHWIVQALFRAFYFHEGKLPETFTVTVLRKVPGAHYGSLEGWNTPVLLAGGEAVEQEGGYRVGDVWETKLTEVHTYWRRISMEGLRLVERLEKNEG